MWKKSENYLDKRFLMNMSETIENSSSDEMEEIIFSVLTWFHKRGLSNPYNYNRGFEFLQSKRHGFELLPVGGGSDGIDKETDITAEFKAAAWKGFGKNGQELSHSFIYNGTSHYPTWEKQEEYAKNKIMRDPYHFMDIIDYEEGCFVRTYKVPAKTVWKLIKPKWYNSWKQSGNRRDPRVGGSISTKDLKGEKFEIINEGKKLIKN